MPMGESNRTSQNVSDERITAENMALLCSKNVKLNLPPIEIPHITVAQVCYQI